MRPGTVELIRLGTRAVFKLASGLVLARVTTAARLSDAQYELSVARWLTSAGVPVDQPWPGSELCEVDGLAVTLWVYREGAWATTRELATVLRKLHAVRRDGAVPLRVWNPYPPMRQRLDASAVLSPPEKAALGTMIQANEAAVRELDFALTPGVIHGDASVGNIWRTPEADLVLFDLESVSIGAREWDLIITSVYRELGWHTEQEYEAFIDEYGTDVRTWSGYTTLAQAQRLRMICWLAGSAVSKDERAVTELRGRVDDLASRSSGFTWTPL
jgi:Ser/Thr protein kinase RdoA (MazF antagonist)